MGRKARLKLRDIWAIRVRLQLREESRELALFNRAIDSKLRACDLVALRVRDVRLGVTIAARATVVQRKTSQPVCFEITDQTRSAVATWLDGISVAGDAYLFLSRVRRSLHLSTRQYARIVHRWEIGLDSSAYGTHSLRRTKAAFDLPPNEEPTCRPATAGAHEAGEHRPLPRNRGR